MASIVYLLCFLFALLHAVIAVRQCYVFPIPHAGGRAQKLDCTSNPGHDYAASGCFYRRYADDSGLQAGFVEGGCGASMCNSGREEKCRDISGEFSNDQLNLNKILSTLLKTEDGFTMKSRFCCCYGEKCNDVAKAEALN